MVYSPSVQPIGMPPAIGAFEGIAAVPMEPVAPPFVFEDPQVVDTFAAEPLPVEDVRGRLIAADLDAVARLKGPGAFHGPSAIGIMNMGGASLSRPDNFAEVLDSWQPYQTQAPAEKIELKWPVHFQNLGPNSILRQAAMLALGLVSEVEDPMVRLLLGFSYLAPGQLPYLPPAVQSLLFGFILLSVIPRASFGGIPNTGRGGFRYLLQLGLLDYDFAGKRVLDVGSGGSLFAALVNFLYGPSGAEAIPMDLNFKPRSKLGILADAAHIPFPDNSFDLVTNNWLYCHYYSFAEGIPMLEEMIRVVRPGGRISIGFSVINNLEPIVRGLRNHPAVAQVYTTPPPGFTRGLTIILRDPKPGADGMRSYYRSLESKGRSNVPWRYSAFEGTDIPSHLARLRHGDAADRVTYVRWLRRLKNASMDIEPDSIETLMRWMEQDSENELLRIVIVTFLMERNEHLDDFKQAWMKLTNDERNMAMRLWLSSASHWGRMRWMSKDYFELEAEYDGDVVGQRQRVQEKIEDDAAVQRAYEKGKREGAHSRM